uniref:Uncharacterized protein n=1 Tax=Romanomermis culicivorax TaxID=13658 RepID=A0A915KHD4_ROMCU
MNAAVKFSTISFKAPPDAKTKSSQGQGVDDKFDDRGGGDKIEILFFCLISKIAGRRRSIAENCRCPCIGHPLHFWKFLVWNFEKKFKLDNKDTTISEETITGALCKVAFNFGLKVICVEPPPKSNAAAVLGLIVEELTLSSITKNLAMKQRMRQ